MNKKILTSKRAEKIQNEIFQKMSPGKKLRMTSRLILPAKKIKRGQRNN